MHSHNRLSSQEEGAQMTCPICGAPTEITRKPTDEESRDLYILKLAVKFNLAKLRAEKTMVERRRSA
jgi:hypothetical protein